MSRVPDEVDAAGNINPHWQAGVDIPIKDTDENGAQIDISAAPWFFVTSGLRKALATDPANPLGRRLVLTKTEVQAIPLDGQPFIVVDETNATVPDARWEGMIIPRGWK